MKYIILILSILFCDYSYTQTQIPDLIISITITFNDPPYPPPYAGEFFKIGLDSTATDSLDNHLGEFDLPPIPPPGYPAVLYLPYNNFSGEIIVNKDFRFGELPYTGTKEHRVRFCSECGATISWDLPPGSTGLLQDMFGGVLVNVPMSGSGSYYVSNFVIWILRIFIYYDNVVTAELNSFTAVSSGNNVVLNWTTATEINNSGFEILRGVYPANSGTQNDNEWEKVGFVPGFGTTTEPKSYSFVDDNVSTGIYKYRLKQIDFDGSFEYSNEIEVEVDFTPKEFVLYQNYPNPFNPGTTIRFSLPESGTVTLKVYNALGQEVNSLMNGFMEAGSHTINFDASSLNSGIYFYRLNSGQFSEVRKMTLIK